MDTKLMNQEKEVAISIDILDQEFNRNDEPNDTSEEIRSDNFHIPSSVEILLMQLL